ncbi:hypothetical protein PHO31112_04644 [Pandoraea horticolens]|uniref:Uncharacterized protein n=1 Tax=Pandoraea horticolens TaxID=2508298 RepID=A0A5E4YQF0_9BURK|nr:sce7725 family protein [Pandoraea horticolens]VVE50163.1 hypothetical protein PHO31112_04644 [Pandoraea horticolens]
MYHPFFRGKQFELLTIRETAALLAESNFTPIIEPVRRGFGGLQRALEAVCSANGKAIVIVNPDCGDYAEDGNEIPEFLNEFAAQENISAGILLTAEMSVADALSYLAELRSHNPTFIHAGFVDARALAEALRGHDNANRHVFLNDYCGRLYARHFVGSDRTVIGDGFEKRKRNADHPPVEEFSDLHVTYESDGMDGFGDFLIVGDDYSEVGGPAYTVAIHLTFIDPEKDDVMYVYHFISETNSTPTDPAGKFAQALAKLIATLDSGTSNLRETNAIREFRELYNRGHFPGLGHVKKLAMKHHIETIAEFLGR